ncbi:MAG: hypothetical protein GX050_06015 [Firmicutes bacterium]|nr:hypothetical protein [Bacillota bacterium]
MGKVDPEKQQAPKAWQGFNIKDKAAALYTYTRNPGDHVGGRHRHRPGPAGK